MFRSKCIQFRYSQSSVRTKLSDLGIELSDSVMPEIRWYQDTTNLTNIFDDWCKESGIMTASFGYTQIEFCVTFSDYNEAMIFKLRWNSV